MLVQRLGIQLQAPRPAGKRAASSCTERWRWLCRAEAPREKVTVAALALSFKGVLRPTLSASRYMASMEFRTAQARAAISLVKTCAEDLAVGGHCCSLLKPLESKDDVALDLCQQPKQLHREHPAAQHERAESVRGWSVQELREEMARCTEAFEIRNARSGLELATDASDPDCASSVLSWSRQVQDPRAPFQSWNKMIARLAVPAR